MHVEVVCICCPHELCLHLFCLPQVQATVVVTTPVPCPCCCQSYQKSLAHQSPSRAAWTKVISKSIAESNLLTLYLCHLFSETNTLSHGLVVSVYAVVLQCTLLVCYLNLLCHVSQYLVPFAGAKTIQSRWCKDPPPCGTTTKPRWIQLSLYPQQYHRSSTSEASFTHCLVVGQQASVLRGWFRSDVTRDS